jgi:hypothetical protein
MLNVIWILKACMLFMFTRMTRGTTHMRWIRLVAIWVVAGWVAVQIAFFTACRPFNGYWAVPPPNPQCTTLEHYAIVQAVFNISSDLLIIALPIPLIASLSLPLKQKIGLGLLFSLGTFVVRLSTPVTPHNTLSNIPLLQIIAAILTKVYNLSNIYAPTYMLWYTREASVSVYVANLPAIWPLLREHIRFLRDSTNSYITGQSKMPPKYGYGSQYGNMSSTKSPRSRVQTDEDSDKIELGNGIRTFGVSGRSGRASLDSDERALREGQPWGVQVDTKVVIQRDTWNERTEAGVDTKIQGPAREVEKR